MSQTRSTENSASTSGASEIPRRLTKAEKKALYKPTYDEPHATRRRVLKDVYVYEKDDALKQELLSSILFSVYEIDDNPYVAMLELHKICPDYTSDKPKTLAGLTANALRCWLAKQENTADIFSRCVSKEIQMEAFRIATAKQTVHLNLFKEVFCLDEPELLPFIKGEINLMIERHFFKEAMDVVQKFELHHDYGLHEFVIPCLLQDQMRLVLTYMENDQQMKRDFLSYLDSFVGQTEDEVITRLKIFKESGVMTMKYERFTGKSLERMIYKLGDELMLPIDSVAPNLFLARKKGELRFKAALTEADEQLKVYFIKLLTKRGNYDDAVRWTVYYNIQESLWPHRLSKHIRETPHALRDAELDIRRMEKRVKEVEEEVIELLAGCFIVTVKNWSQLRELMDKLENESYIGIDAEGKPLYMGVKESVALLQVAITGAVYLVDFCLLEEVLVESQWKLFIQKLLCSSSMKIGFDIANDLRFLFASPSINPLRCVLDEMCNVVCLKLLVEKLVEVDRHFFEMEEFVNDNADDVQKARDFGIAAHLKLSVLAEKLLGIKLDKSEQCSNWAARPLRISQKRYAAMDAYIVVSLFLKLKSIAESRGMDFHAMIQNSTVAGKKMGRIKSKKERIKLEDMTWGEICEKLGDVLCGTRKTTDFRFIVDSMLFGLGKNMRRCGVNVLTPENRQELICKARESQRIILTCGKAYDELRQTFTDRVFQIPNPGVMNPIEQLRFVFTKYKVSFSGLDAFSRCMECNSTCIVKAPGIVIQALHQSVVTCRNSFHDEAFNVFGWAKRLSSVDPQKYSGIGCQLIFHGDTNVIVECYGGTIDIIANIVTHDNLEEGVEVIIKRVPEEVARSCCVFHICASCGEVYWESDPQEL